METISGSATISAYGSDFNIRKGDNISYKPVKKRMLIIAPFHKGIGGAETYLFSLMEEASKRYDVFLASLIKPPQLWQGTPIRKVLGICWELYRDARKHKDIQTIDCHGLQAALVGMVLRRFRKFKFCITMLALYDFKDRPWWFRWVCRIILNSADKIFVEGETGKKDLLDCGVRECKIVKFMHWVDLDRFKPSGKKHKGITVLFVGRAIPIKGKHIIEEVERRLFYLKDLRFVYVEDIPYKDLPDYYRRADILVVPSLYSEGFARVVAEGAASGCAVITSDRGALPEMVSGYGIYIPPDKELFSKTIMIFRNDRSAMYAAKTLSRLYAEKYFNRKNAEVIINEYR